jgi:lipopolysaccharide transport system ATP-binding protein
MSAAIVVSRVGKAFRRYHPQRPRTIQEVLARGFRRIGSADRFWGLRDVSFEVPAGRTVGIVGTNGSGKSTLLRLVGGIGKVDEGKITVRGRIGALLDLGSGFHPDLTGRENAMVSGVLAGLTRREVLARLDSIVAFAEVEKFIDNPMRTYSTGMQMRLAFSTAVHTNPEVLLIDEVLSVGDTAFQKKCLDRIAEFKAKGCSILLVSHESSVVQDLCDEVLWLNQGRLMAYDRAPAVVQKYLEFITGGAVAAPQPESEPAPGPALPRPTVRTDRGAEVPINEERFGSVELEIRGVRVSDGAGSDVTSLAQGAPLSIAIDYEANDRLIAPLFRVRILRADGVVCYDVNSEHSELSTTSIQGPGTVSLRIDRIALNEGRYTLDVSVYAQDWAYAYDQQSAVSSFTVGGGRTSDAVIQTSHHWETVALKT